MSKKEAGESKPDEVKLTSKFSRGYNPDAHDERDWKARALLGAARAIPAEATELEQFLRGIRNQGGTSSCVGHALGTAVDVRLRKLGYSTPDFSRIAPYTMARVLARTRKDEKLTDDGCFPRYAMLAAREVGIPFEEAWPIDESKVNEELPWDVTQQASPYRLAAFWRVDSSGTARVNEVCNALSKGLPVIFGAQIGKAFEDWNGKGVAPISTSKDVLGGHMLCALTYTTVNGRRRIRGPNSWGPWGDHGMYVVDEEFIADQRTTDIYVIQAEVRP